MIYVFFANIFDPKIINYRSELDRFCYVSPKALVCGHIHHTDEELAAYVIVYWLGLIWPVTHKRPCKFLD